MLVRQHRGVQILISRRATEFLQGRERRPQQALHDGKVEAHGNDGVTHLAVAQRLSLVAAAVTVTPSRELGAAGTKKSGYNSVTGRGVLSPRCGGEVQTGFGRTDDGSVAISSVVA